jgi:hypothetical protein
MKLRFLALFFAFAFATLTSHAQIGLYVNPAITHISNSTPDTGPFAFLGDGSTSRTFWGANFGGYTDFFHGKSVDAGIDVRDSIVVANNAHLNSFLIGGRVVAKNISPSWRPYLQLSGGVGSSKSPYSTLHISRGQWGVYGGVDYKLSRHVDVRAVEVGYGTVSTISSDTVGGSSSIPVAHLLNVTAGLVFRIR